MSDRRYFAKMDVGYYSNPKWYRVERYVHQAMQQAMPDAMQQAMQLAMRHAVRTAQALHSASIYYCREHNVDGVFPVEAVKRIVGIASPEEELAVTALFEVGMWINKPLGEAEIRDYLEHQEPAHRAQVRMKRAQKAAAARWSKDATSNAVSNASSNATSNANAMPVAMQRRGEERRSNTPSIEGVGDSADAPAPSKRGTRLPDAFTVTADMRAWAATTTPTVDVDVATAKFCDYWRAQPGQRGTKLDWIATWRNWLRRDAEDAARRGGYRSQDQIMRDMQAKAAARTASMGSALNLIEGGRQ